MSIDNPYQPPSSNVEVKPVATDIWAFVEPKSLPIGYGWRWIAEGFRLFRKNPLIWIINFVIFFAIMMVLAFQPLLSIVGNILQPLFMGGFMRGAFSVDTTDRLDVGHLFAGFSERAGPLALAGLLYLVIFAVLVGGGAVATMVVLGSLEAFMELQTGAGSPETVMSLAIVVLIVMAAFIPVIMAYWFVPPLVMLHKMSVLSALKTSFMGCLRNILPFLWFSIVMLLLGIIATIPLMLGLLVLLPVLIASIYAAWKDIFTNAGTTPAND